jgi:hypothetical protein
VINQTAYLALMRALGFDRKEMPPSFRLLDPNTEIDKNIIQKARDRLLIEE